MSNFLYRDRCWRSTEESRDDTRFRFSLFMLCSYIRVLPANTSIQFCNSIVDLDVLFLWRLGLNNIIDVYEGDGHRTPADRVAGKQQK